MIKLKFTFKLIFLLSTICVPMNCLSPVYHLCISVSIMNIYLLPVTYLLSINILSMRPLSTVFLPTTINFPCLAFSKLFLPAFLFKISFILNSFNGSPVNICRVNGHSKVSETLFIEFQNSIQMHFCPTVFKTHSSLQSELSGTCSIFLACHSCHLFAELWFQIPCILRLIVKCNRKAK